MTLVLKPRGRGNWKPVLMTLAGERAAPLLLRAGMFLELGGIVFRITKVQP